MTSRFLNWRRVDDTKWTASGRCYRSREGMPSAVSPEYWIVAVSDGGRPVWLAVCMFNGKADALECESDSEAVLTCEATELRLRGLARVQERRAAS